jgi:hypothetical protein
VQFSRWHSKDDASTVGWKEWALWHARIDDRGSLDPYLPMPGCGVEQPSGRHEN